MDKKVILAVAGSGKTFHLVEQLNESKRFLIITYTNANVDNLRKSIIRKFGYLPSNINIKSYFTFLYSFCFKPFLAAELACKGIYWKFPPDHTRNYRRDNNSYYLLQKKWLYHNRIAKLIIERSISDHVNERLEKYYDNLLVDEVQDFGGHDFNLLLSISKSNLNILYVGDFFQHTFSTSIDGKVNINLYKNELNYLKNFKIVNFNIDNETLVNSRRCSKTICDFIREKVGIEIFPHEDRESEYKLVTNEQEAEEIFFNNSIIKLFLQGHYKYNCKSDNWGSCKGLEFDNVCVVINDATLKLYNKNELSKMSPTTKNKFYVACSRARGNLYFVPDKFYKKYREQK